jgi:hypothetical protein
MNNTLKDLKLGQQLGLMAGGLCLLIGFALVALGATSSRHMQLEQQRTYGAALAHQIARRISTALETGDLLSIAASLQHFVETSSAERVAIFDVEGQALGRAGEVQGQNTHEYRAPVLIDNDIAGEVVIAISVDSALAAQRRLVLSLSGLTILLGLGGYGLARHLGQRMGDSLGALSQQLALETGGDPEQQHCANELATLARHVEALPLDLLRARRGGPMREEHYHATAVLYLQLNSLANYVDTLDQQSLQRYTRRLHQVVFGAAGFYAGELQVVRQFGLAVYFSGESQAGSAAFRAASCAWLIQELCRELDKQQSLSMSVSMAISHSETGSGDGADIYPGLYIQHVLDDLQNLCSNRPPKILLAPPVCADDDMIGRVETAATEVGGCAMLEGFAEPYSDLLERQLRLIWKRLAAT